MYGLARAAHAKGVNAVGMRLSVDDLRTNHIVHVVLNGTPHYSVVREVTSESVYLADPSKGNIVLSREGFSAIFTGNVLVISGLLNQTETTNQTNVTAPVSVQAENQTLTAETMRDIWGRGGRNRVVWRWWGRIVYLCNLTTRKIVWGMDTVAGIAAAFKIPIKVAAAIFASARLLYLINIRNRGVRVWVAWTRHILWIASQ
ncbi:MAG: cysteine peptidase family C39 domain-containing protein [Methanobacterium sp.]|jgi:predicted double-glycine peptidase